MIMERLAAGTRAAEFRERSEVILDRATLLEPGDRALLEQVLGRGVLPRQVALVSGDSVRKVQRRVKRLIDRLGGTEVVYILRQRQRWSGPTAAVAVALWVRGRTLRQAAAELGLTLHAVRMHAQAIRGYLDEGARNQAAVRRAAGRMARFE